MRVQHPCSAHSRGPKCSRLSCPPQPRAGEHSERGAATFHHGVVCPPLVGSTAARACGRGGELVHRRHGSGGGRGASASLTLTDELWKRGQMILDAHATHLHRTAGSQTLSSGQSSRRRWKEVAPRRPAATASIHCLLGGAAAAAAAVAAGGTTRLGRLGGKRRCGRRAGSRSTDRPRAQGTPWGRRAPTSTNWRATSTLPALVSTATLKHTYSQVASDSKRVSARQHVRRGSPPSGARCDLPRTGP